MKSLLYTLLIAFIVGAFACGDKDEPGNNPPKKRIDTNTLVTIRGQKQSDLKASKAGEMSYEDSVKFIARWAKKWHLRRLDGSANTYIGIGREYRDTISHKLLWGGYDIFVMGIDPITKDTVYNLGKLITEYTNIVVTMGIHDDGTPYQWDDELSDYEPIPDKDLDTVAYIPNNVILLAREKIVEAYNNNNYERVYELFDSAYIFVPTTGLKYRALMEKGEN